MIHSHTRPINRTSTTIAHSETKSQHRTQTNKIESAPKQQRQPRHPLSPLLLELARKEVVVDHVHFARAVVIVRVLIVVVNPVHRRRSSAAA